MNHFVFTIGAEEVANINSDLKNTFGSCSRNINLTPSKFYLDNLYDYSLKSSNKITPFIKIFYGPYLLVKLSHQSDIFIYLWWTGFCIDREMDYKFLKKKKKKIVCIFLGSDIRSPLLTLNHFKEKNEDTWLNYTHNSSDVQNEDSRTHRVARLADKYADIIFNHSSDQISYLCSAQHIFPYMIAEKKLFFNMDKFSNMQKPIIVHAPSKSVVKGTPLVRAVIKKLELEGYSFEYKEFQNTPNRIVMEALKTSHIVINEFYALAPGVFSIEGMASCNAVITSADYDNFPEDAQYAWYRTKYWEIYDHLKYLLDNPEKIKIFASKGFEFVKNNYTEEKVKQFYRDTFFQYGIINDKNAF